MLIMLERLIYIVLCKALGCFLVRYLKKKKRVEKKRPIMIMIVWLLINCHVHNGDE